MTKKLTPALISILVLTFLTAGIAPGQQRGRIPSVDQLIGNHDENKDGKLSRQEVAGSNQLARKFDRWDTDKDGIATREETVALRRTLGIDAEGRRTGQPGKRPGVPAKLPFPAIDEITRTDGRNRATPEERQFSLTIVKTEPHPVSDGGYVIIGDPALQPFEKMTADNKQ